MTPEEKNISRERGKEIIMQRLEYFQNDECCNVTYKNLRYKTDKYHKKQYFKGIWRDKRVQRMLVNVKVL